MKRKGRRGCAISLTCALGLLLCLWALTAANDPHRRAGGVLADVGLAGLSARLLLNDRVEAGGFGADGDEIRLLQLDDSALDAMRTARGWTVAPVGREAQRDLMADIAGPLGRVVSADVETDYDAWFFRDDRAGQSAGEAGALQEMRELPLDRPSDYTIAFYDEETRLLLVYEYDS